MVRKRLPPGPRKSGTSQADFRRISKTLGENKAYRARLAQEQVFNIRQNQMKNTKNRPHLIRNLIHDWLLHCSSHGDKARQQRIKIILHKLESQPNRPGHLRILKALRVTNKRATRAHQLPALISDCQKEEDDQTLDALLSLYIEADETTLALKKSKKSCLLRSHTPSHDTRHEQAEKSAATPAEMGQPSIVTRMKRLWTNRNRFG
jgi:hypothetical protein